MQLLNHEGKAIRDPSMPIYFFGLFVSFVVEDLLSVAHLR